MILSPLEAQEEPESLKRAQEQIRGLMPWVELLELVLEIAARMQFTQDFTPLLSDYARLDSDLTLSLCAVLVVEPAMCL